MSVGAALDFLARPRVRRVRRWSFVVTVPVAVALIAWLGIEGGLALAALEALVLLVLLAVALRLGGARGEVVLDLVMHPVARRAMRLELLLLATLPHALVRRERGETFSYHRGTMELGLALALIPAAAVELAIVELLLPASWLWAKVAIAALSLYGVLSFVSLAAGMRVYRHRLVGDALEVRLGRLYRALVPLSAIDAVEARRERSGDRTRLLREGERALLLVGGRVDVHLRLREPVTLERPLGDPLAVRELAFAADDARALVHRLEEARA